MRVGLFKMVAFVALLLIPNGVSYGVSAPVLTFKRHGQMKDESDRNVVDLNCREGDRNIEAFFWNGSTQLNSVATSTYMHILTPETEAIIVCKNINGITSNRIKLAALPKKQNQSRTICAYLGEQAQLPCDYIPGNLRELYQVQWKFLRGVSVMPFTPSSLPFGTLQSIGNDSFSLSVSVNSLNQTGDQFYCEVHIQSSDNSATKLKYEGSTIELQVKEPAQIIMGLGDMNVTMGQPVKLMCSAKGTDTMLHWEIDSQTYSDCSNVDFCVTFSKLNGIFMSSIMFRDDSFHVKTVARMKCVVTQMCGNERVLFSEANIHIEFSANMHHNQRQRDEDVAQSSTSKTATRSSIISFIPILVVIFLVIASILCLLGSLHYCKRGAFRGSRHSTWPLTGYHCLTVQSKRAVPKMNQKQVSTDDTCSQISVQHQNNIMQSLCFDKHIDSFHCESEGYIYINKKHDVTVIFPKGAVHEIINVEIGIMLYGPFSFPENSQPVSPILLLRVHPTTKFFKPIQVVLPHYLNCTTESDCKQLVFMKADHSSIDTKYHFKETDGKAVFKPHINYGFLYTSHCCLQCIMTTVTEATPRTKFALITAYPKNPDPRVTVYFGVTYFLATCMETFKSHFREDYKFLQSLKFEMKDSGHNRRIKIHIEEHPPHNWTAFVNHRNKIYESDVNFLNIDREELVIMESEQSYPPNFQVTAMTAYVDRPTGSSILRATFSGVIANPPLKVKVPLSLPASPSGSARMEMERKVSSASSLGSASSMDANCKDDGTFITTAKLQQELQAVSEWFTLGLQLNVQYHKLKEIENAYPSPIRRQAEMFQAWIDGQFEPSWATVVEALLHTGMERLAHHLAVKYGVNLV